METAGTEGSGTMDEPKPTMKPNPYDLHDQSSYQGVGKLYEEAVTRSRETGKMEEVCEGFYVKSYEIRFPNYKEPTEEELRRDGILPPKRELGTLIAEGKERVIEV